MIINKVNNIKIVIDYSNLHLPHEWVLPDWRLCFNSEGDSVFGAAAGGAFSIGLIGAAPWFPRVLPLCFPRIRAACREAVRFRCSTLRRHTSMFSPHCH